MNNRTRIWFALTLAALFLGAVATVARSAPKGGKALLMTFDDLEGDAILSDTFGPYDATISGRGDDLKMSTGPRELFFDFSMPLEAEFDTPFLGDDSGWISGVELIVASFPNRLPGTSYASGSFEFHAPAPDGSGPALWVLTFIVEVITTENPDGTLTYAIEGEEANVRWWDGSAHQGPGGRGGRGFAGWRSAGRFYMPWGAVVERP